IELAPDHTALGPPGPRGRIHPDAFHQGQIDDHAAIVGAVPRRAVAAPADRQFELVRACETNRLLHVGDAGASRDERRSAVDVAVPDAPGLVVAGMIALYQFTAESTAK